MFGQNGASFGPGQMRLAYAFQLAQTSVKHSQLSQQQQAASWIAFLFGVGYPMAGVGQYSKNLRAEVG